MTKATLMSDQEKRQSRMGITIDEEGGCGASEPFALRVLGDSMSPEFKEGCIIIIDPAGLIRHGSYVLAQLDDGEYIFRQLRIERGRHFLNPLNGGYETIEITNKEAIQGVVVQRGGRRRTDIKHYL